jgi:zinc transport system permease protein
MALALRRLAAGRRARRVAAMRAARPQYLSKGIKGTPILANWAVIAKTLAAPLASAAAALAPSVLSAAFAASAAALPALPALAMPAAPATALAACATALPALPALAATATTAMPVATAAAAAPALPTILPALLASALQYGFMRRAFAVGILLAVIIPCIGIVVVLKRLSMIGDALSHSSLAGVAAGLIMGINPVLGAAAACVAAALGIEAIRKKIPQYSEMSIAIVMSAGVGLAGVLSGFVKNAANFNSFLFGSIVAISDLEMYIVVCVSAAVSLAFVLLYKELFYIALDERAARLAGVPVGPVNFVFTILTAVTVSVAARTVGALIVSSMMVVPVACAMQFGKSYRQTVVFSVCFAVAFTVAGLFAAYFARLKPGGAIVLLGVACLLLIIAAKRAWRFFRRRG